MFLKIAISDNAPVNPSILVHTFDIQEIPSPPEVARIRHDTWHKIDDELYFAVRPVDGLTLQESLANKSVSPLVNSDRQIGSSFDPSTEPSLKSWDAIVSSAVTKTAKFRTDGTNLYIPSDGANAFIHIPSFLLQSRQSWTVRGHENNYHQRPSEHGVVLSISDLHDIRLDLLTLRLHIPAEWISFDVSLRSHSLAREALISSTRKFFHALQKARKVHHTGLLIQLGRYNAAEFERDNIESLVNLAEKTLIYARSFGQTTEARNLRRHLVDVKVALYAWKRHSSHGSKSTYEDPAEKMKDSYADFDFDFGDLGFDPERSSSLRISSDIARNASSTDKDVIEESDFDFSWDFDLDSPPQNEKTPFEDPGEDDFGNPASENPSAEFESASEAPLGTSINLDDFIASELGGIIQPLLEDGHDVDEVVNTLYKWIHLFVKAEATIRKMFGEEDKTSPSSD